MHFNSKIIVKIQLLHNFLFKLRVCCYQRINYPRKCLVSITWGFYNLRGCFYLWVWLSKLEVLPSLISKFRLSFKSWKQLGNLWTVVQKKSLECTAVDWVKSISRLTLEGVQKSPRGVSASARSDQPTQHFLSPLLTLSVFSAVFLTLISTATGARGLHTDIRCEHIAHSHRRSNKCWTNAPRGGQQTPQQHLGGCFFREIDRMKATLFRTAENIWLINTCEIIIAIF